MSLARSKSGDLITDLSNCDHPRIRAVAEIIHRTNPDILLLNELDYDPQGRPIALFQHNYLSVPRNGTQPVTYPYSFSGPVNTGLDSSFDLNNDGQLHSPDDALGYGRHPGQYGMVLLSRYPIVHNQVRTFQKFLWKDMPGAMLPDDPATAAPQDYYSPEELAVFRLSSKSHWDIPVRIGRHTLHILASHPTPPVFDGPQDRNGRRNHDEIRFWYDYITPSQCGYIYDDLDNRGGLAENALFVIAGDLNADPCDGDTAHNAIRKLLSHPRINPYPVPGSRGALEAAQQYASQNAHHAGDPAYDTGAFSSTGNGPGNLRVDYVLPSRPMQIQKAVVFWPESRNPLHRLTGHTDEISSDHRLVYIDVLLPK